MGSGLKGEKTKQTYYTVAHLFGFPESVCKWLRISMT